MVSVEVSERFADYPVQAKSKDIQQWQFDIRQLLSTGTSPHDIVDKSVAAGWDKAFADYFVFLVHARKDPFLLVPRKSASERRRDFQNESSKMALMWFALWFVSAILMSQSALFILAMWYFGYRGFATWGEMKGFSSSSGWWTLMPLVGFPVMLFSRPQG